MQTISSQSPIVVQNRAIDFSTFGDEEIYCPLITLEEEGVD